ncbi:molybdopterin molybdotransferase MoeA [Allorhizobium sp. BGMRC 0089]|uniref:molybdopterin molybdotransferase MoeA n=1 Tax=Allorhizobium sonneratiae TaxID=2934936 RepID=UPI0020337387|nr:gephyrin-like molybdotransferase Glp [Allorhizobium sonneratiae]MCM2293737.1 molybdopterin molybdotransferase MoeA [Allorhizobium sonneratiae]
MALLPVEQAQARLLEKAHPLTGTEDVPLSVARDRILAADVHANLTQPPFNASAMDGYALKSEDAAEAGVELTVVGESAAGRAFTGTFSRGECVRIFTGAPVPDEADAVLIQENVKKHSDENRIIVLEPVGKNRNIRPRGQDFAAGDRLMTAGTCLGFSTIMLAAASNNAVVRVYKKPLVALIATGDELVSAGEIPGPDQIIASNSYGLKSLAESLGAEVLDLGLVRDDRKDIIAAIRRAEAAGADVLVTTGGASVGDHDLVQPALLEAGMVLDFWKIAMRPGKPLMVGRLGPMTVLGLPGNPVSSMVCALLFLEPLICRLGHRQRPDRLRMARTATALAANDQRQDYLRARIMNEDGAAMVATPFSRQDSSMMRVLAEANGLIIRPPHAPALEAGAPCPVLLLDL